MRMKIAYFHSKDEMGVPRCEGTPITDTCPFPTLIN